jgi:hypothetical protein
VACHHCGLLVARCTLKLLFESYQYEASTFYAPLTTHAMECPPLYQPAEKMSRNELKLNAGTITCEGVLYSLEDLQVLNDNYYQAREKTWQVGGQLNEMEKKRETLPRNGIEKGNNGKSVLSMNLSGPIWPNGRNTCNCKTFKGKYRTNVPTPRHFRRRVAIFQDLRIVANKSKSLWVDGNNKERTKRDWDLGGGTHQRSTSLVHGKLDIRSTSTY